MRNTIRLIYSGGLGNQLFQYAIYLYLKQKYPNANVIPDLFSYLYHSHHNGFEVQKILNLDFEQKVDKIQKMHGKIDHRFAEPHRLIRLSLQKLIGYKTIYDSEALDPHTLDKIIKSNGKILLAGFFQCPIFINIIANEIRRRFKSNQDLGAACNGLLENIKNRESVSLHIRRGDYLSIPEYNIFNGLKYYENAVAYFKEHFNNPIFLIFSNDPEWVKENLNLGKDVISVTCNQGMDSYKDLLLMARCNHNIIANSSFSWWGAWLNPHQDKIVISPKDWFKNISSDIVVPKEWLRFEN